MLLAGCDLGGPPSLVGAGPPLRIVALYPGNGEGETCQPASPDDCGVPTNASILLRFDRYVDPATVKREAIRVYSSAPGSGSSFPFDVNYDPVERVAAYTLRPGYSFTTEALYQIEFPVALQDGDAGFRAFDGARLAEGEIPLKTSFFTARVAAELPSVPAPTCDQIVTQVFGGGLGNCSSAACHRSVQAPPGAAPHGLWLDGRQNFRATAVGRVAHQTEIGDRAGVALADPPRFGVQMPLIEPGNAGNSYLLYKLLRAPQNFEACTPLQEQALELCAQPADPCVSAYTRLPLVDGQCLPPSEAESQRLREWFVRGESMPAPVPLDDPGQFVLGSVRLQGLRALASFISAGADCSQ